MSAKLVFASPNSICADTKLIFTFAKPVFSRAKSIFTDTKLIFTDGGSFLLRDHPKDDSIIEPLLKQLLPLLNRAGKITRGKVWSGLTLETLREDIDLHSFGLFWNNPNLTKHDELVALWMYERSLRLAWLIELLGGMLNDNVERIGNVRFGAKNN